MYYLLLITAISTFIFSTPIYADTGTNQYGQYGGGSPTSALLVDKMVSKGNQTKGGQIEYVDNYSPSDSRFKPNERVYFQIKVKNTASTTLKDVQMSDKLPEYVDAVEGPGDYNNATKIITWNYNELKSGEERIEKLVVQIKPQAQLPADRSTFCANNMASGQSGNAKDHDTAQFCIEKQIEQTKGGVPTQAPQAGAEFALLFGALNIAGLGAGVYLKRKI